MMCGLYKWTKDIQMPNVSHPLQLQKQIQHSTGMLA